MSNDAERFDRTAPAMPAGLYSSLHLASDVDDEFGAAIGYEAAYPALQAPLWREAMLLPALLEP